MHHITAACRSNIIPVNASNVRTPSQSSSNSSMRGCRNTSKSFPGDLGPGMSNTILKLDSSIHAQGGRLYGTINTSHMLYEELIMPNELKPSVESPSLKFLASCANQGYLLLNAFHASP